MVVFLPPSRLHLLTELLGTAAQSVYCTTPGAAIYIQAMFPGKSEFLFFYWPSSPGQSGEEWGLQSETLTIVYSYQGSQLPHSAKQVIRWAMSARREAPDSRK